MQSGTQTKGRSNGGGPTSAGPFDLAADEAYRRWRDAKLADYPRDVSELMVAIADLGNPGKPELSALTGICRKANMAVYVSPVPAGDDARTRHDLRAFAQALGLRHPEGHRSAGNRGVVAIEIAEDAGRRGYIPYSDRPLSWHTDGYYNQQEDRVRAFLLHCVRGAKEGGENRLLDPEIAYIRLRDENPEFIAALSHPQAMTIPANVEADGTIRPDSTGPVFALDARTGALQMRYTARTRSIVWRRDPATQAATDFMARLLAGDDALIFRHKLEPGQGLICNNVLHSRAGFRDVSPSGENAGRLLYRIRYMDRIADTGLLAQTNQRI